MWIASALLLAAVDSASVVVPPTPPATVTTTVCTSQPDAKKPDTRKPPGTTQPQCVPIRPVEQPRAGGSQTTNLFVNAAAGTADRGDAAQPDPKPVATTCACDCCGVAEATKADRPDTAKSVLGSISIKDFTSIAALTLLELGAFGLLLPLVFASRRSRIEPPRSALEDPRRTIRYRRHWGSFGGESTGWTLEGFAWTVSPRLVLASVSLIFIVVGLWLLMELLAREERLATRPCVAVVACKPAAK